MKKDRRDQLLKEKRKKKGEREVDEGGSIRELSFSCLNTFSSSSTRKNWALSRDKYERLIRDD